MMQDGLQIGLAAWIGAQREGDGFVVWPALPFAMELINFEVLLTMRDLARAAEFARMVNFTPRKGKYASPFAAEGVLWETHRDLLGRMVFAVRAWTPQEDAEWRAARQTLYEIGADGFPRMTPAFQLYDELRIAYSELVAAGADAAEVAAAHAAWVGMGNKLEIEAALSTINRLAQRSSLPRAEEERLALEPARLPATADGSYADTAFSPLTAVRVESWLGAEATLDELEAAIGSDEPRAKWTAWRAARMGSVRFRFAVLDLNRSWFSQAIYEADDWRLDNDWEVSRGDSVGGKIPAYVGSVYLAIVDNLRTDVKPPVPREPTIPFPRPRPLPVMDPAPVLPARPAERLPGLMVRPASGHHLSLSADARTGVRSPSFASLAAQPASAASPVVSRPLALSTRAPDMQLRHAHFGSVQRVTMMDFSARVSLANRLVNAGSPTAPGTGPTSQEVYVVGFGCIKLPASPAPNPGYQWTMS